MPTPEVLTINAQSHKSERCNQGWGNFARENELRSTQEQFSETSELDDNILEEIDHLSSNDVRHLVVHPPSKFAFCGIEKNGSSQWLTVLAKLVNNNTRIQGPSYYLGKKSQERFGGLATVKRMLSDRETFLVVMVRDPLARFASAYLNKCFQNMCNNPFCFTRHHFQLPPGSPVTFRLTLDWFLNHTNPDPAVMDGHWRMQSETECGLKKLLPRYNVIALMTKPTLSSDATCIMELAGVSEFNVDGKTNATFWKERTRMRVGDQKYSDEDEEEVLKKLFTKDAALRLMEKFRPDYELFHLPKPSWIESATGEWMDSVNHHKCNADKA